MREKFSTREQTNHKEPAYWLRFWSRVIAWLQILAGVYGAYQTIFGPIIGSSRPLLFFGFCLFLAAIGGGTMLILDHAAGINLSIVVQSLQLIQINVGSFVYSFVCGFQLIVGAFSSDGNPELGMCYYLPSRFFVSDHPPPTFITTTSYSGVNIIAVLAIICLALLRNFQKSLSKISGQDMNSAPDVWPPPPSV